MSSRISLAVAVSALFMPAFAPLSPAVAAEATPTSTAAPDDCTGCIALRNVAHRLRKVGPKDYDGQAKLIDAAAGAIEALPAADAKGWSKDQIHEVVALLVAAYPYDGYFSIPQVNTERFTSQRKALLEEAGRLPKKQAEEVRQMIQIGLAEPGEAAEETAPPKSAAVKKPSPHPSPRAKKSGSTR